MPGLSRKIALTDEELDELMTSSWNMRIATIGMNDRINLTPMWFGWVNGKIYFTGRGQKIVNLRRNPSTTLLVDKNERFPDLVGAMFQGTARVLESADEEVTDTDLEEARIQIGTKYAGGHGETNATAQRRDSTANGDTNRWVVFTPDRLVSWDNPKISALRAARQQS
jgi:nitroimidazol reductase NimA-like FMN-containing flavoprotein (pyridoxamine 5'-phosphate oxidase superfamily)